MNTRVRTKSGLMGWQGQLQDQYDSFEEFDSASEIYGLALRLGFDSADDAWNKNPLVQGSVNPDDYCRVEQGVDISAKDDRIQA